jgi:hypothetical protein
MDTLIISISYLWLSKCYCLYELVISFRLLYTQKRNCWVIWKFYFHFHKKVHNVYRDGHTNLPSQQKCLKPPFFSTPSPTLVTYYLFYGICHEKGQVVSHRGFDFHLFIVAFSVIFKTSLTRLMSRQFPLCFLENLCFLISHLRIFSLFCMV